MTTTDEAVALVDARPEPDFAALVSRLVAVSMNNWGAQIKNAEAALLAALSANRAEIERLTNCLRERPNTLLIAHEDGDHQRLSRALAKQTDLRIAAEATITELRKALKDAHEALRPFARLAAPRYPNEGGAPSFIDIMTQNGDQDELELRSFTAASNHIEILQGDDFRRARAIATEVK